MNCRRTARRRFSPATYAGILNRQAHCCAVCGDEFKAGDRIDYDHEIALAAGGKDEPENLRAVHKGCHLDKTRSDATKIAKIRRIREKGGLTRTPRTAFEKEIARLARLETE